MADQFGNLTQEDQAKINAWWQKNWKAPVVCPVCKTSGWSSAPHVVNFPRHAQDALVPGAQSYPHIMVVCDVCGHSMFFNAVKIGVSTAFTERSAFGALGQYLGSGSPAPSALSALEATHNPLTGLPIFRKKDR